MSNAQILDPVTTEPGMWVDLSPAQQAARQEFRAFAQERLVPNASQWDREKKLPLSVIQELRERGYLGAPMPKEAGGGGMDSITYGLLTEEIGKGCSSTRTLLTVHDMATSAVWRWGNAYLKSEIVPQLAKVEKFCAFALTEPEVGSDARNIKTEARKDGDSFVIDGSKMWISLGLIADVFLVFAKCDGKASAFVVPADTPGLSRKPTPHTVGTRATYLAELKFEGCRIPESNLVGRIGFGFSHVATAGLELGRYSVAWGSIAIAQACLEATQEYTSKRIQFGKPLADHQLVRRKLTDMIVGTRAARLLCYRAGTLREMGDPGVTMETMMAKYYASRIATKNASDAVQLHGAHGLSEDYPIERYMRDSKVMEIIEGSTQIQQNAIPKYPVLEL